MSAAGPTVFYTGTHHDGWLSNPAADFPLFVSHRRLARRKTLKPSTHGWALDSGGFTELSTYGEWRTTPQEYVRATARYDREIGKLDWAAPMDRMCEDGVITGGAFGPQKFAGTQYFRDLVDRGVPAAKAVTTVMRRHQDETVENFLVLREMWPQESDSDCPYMPALQGKILADYLRCEALYNAAGVRLENYPVVGLGSVCRRQGTAEIHTIVSVLASMGLSLHGFGMKTLAVAQVGPLLASADSEAWSYAARRRIVHCDHGLTVWAANCPRCATDWREDVLDRLGSVQLALPIFGSAA